MNSYMEKKNFTDVQYYLRLGSVYRNLTDGEITISFLIPISCELKGLKKPWGHKRGHMNMRSYLFPLFSIY